jgi:hypothetical protein
MDMNVSVGEGCAFLFTLPVSAEINLPAFEPGIAKGSY